MYVHFGASTFFVHKQKQVLSEQSEDKSVREHYEDDSQQSEGKKTS